MLHVKIILGIRSVSQNATCQNNPRNKECIAKCYMLKNSRVWYSKILYVKMNSRIVKYYMSR